MAAKLFAAVRGVFAVFIVLYSINSRRALLASKDRGTWGSIGASDWQSAVEWQLGIASVSLIVAVRSMGHARTYIKNY